MLEVRDNMCVVRMRAGGMHEEVSDGPRYTIDHGRERQGEWKSGEMKEFTK
jgi:hypothetical protein